MGKKESLRWLMKSQEKLNQFQVQNISRREISKKATKWQKETLRRK